jgi:hypothetical protein
MLAHSQANCQRKSLMGAMTKIDVPLRTIAVEA